jgi:hypothetical protein
MFARDRQTEPWVEQWKRVDRWWLKLQEAYGAYTPADEMVDLFYVFFQNTFQMRDWFVESGLDRTKVQAVFNSRALQLCRDIANASKHCSLVGKCVDPGFRIVREHDESLFRAGSARWEVFMLIANGRKIDLYGLCLGCMEEIQGFLIRERLWGTESAPTCSEFCFGPR